MQFDNLCDYINNNREYISEQSMINEVANFNERKLNVKFTDVNDFIKKNDVKEIKNPIFFIRNGIPTPDGLLSNEIFGITKEERANIWGYIDLLGHYLNPFIYKIWSRMDGNIKNIVHGVKSYTLTKEGYITEDPTGKGGTGLDWLYKNMPKIKIKPTDSRARKNNIAFIEANRDKLFIDKMLVQPPFYRDVLSNGGRTEVGQLNKYYASLLIATKSLRETQDFGFNLGDSAKGRVQECLLSIFKCITGTSNDPQDGTGLTGKLGIINNSLARTVDMGTRLVLSAPELKVERLEDLMTDTEYCALPLASAIVNFKPFVVFAVKRYFDNEFGNSEMIPILYKGKLVYGRVKNAKAVYSDERIEHEINEYIHGFSNRFKPVQVEVELEDGKTVMGTIRFKGKFVKPDEVLRVQKEGDVLADSSLINRPLTWLDVLYIAATEATQDKCVLITRYPIDSAYNQIPQKIHISTTKEIEPVLLSGKFYRWYPKIKASDISTNTSNKFIDTLNISNLLIGGMMADYDGDTVGVKGVWLQESNEELMKFIKSKSHYINFSGGNFRSPSNEAIQSLYSMTKILPQDLSKVTDPVF